MDEEPPDAPEGYGSPRPIGYPTGMLLLGSIGLALVAAGVYGALLASLQRGVLGLAGNAGLGAMLGPFVVAVVVTVVAHELLHGLAFRRHGYDVEYGVIPTKGVFYTATIGQFQRREDLVLVALTPLVVITVVTMPLLAAPVPGLARTAFLVLLLNTSGAVGDLYIAWRLWRMRPGTLLYDVDLQRMYAYRPVN